MQDKQHYRERVSFMKTEDIKKLEEITERLENIIVSFNTTNGMIAENKDRISNDYAIAFDEGSFESENKTFLEKIITIKDKFKN